jgi:hypothetical protein
MIEAAASVSATNLPAMALDAEKLAGSGELTRLAELLPALELECAQLKTTLKLSG